MESGPEPSATQMDPRKRTRVKRNPLSALLRKSTGAYSRLLIHMVSNRCAPSENHISR